MTTPTATSATAIAVAVVPYLCVDGAARAIEFYKDAFGAIEVMRMTDPTGKIGHAEILKTEEIDMTGRPAPKSSFP